MTAVMVRQNQGVMDIALQYCGSNQSAQDICLLNNISISDPLVPGSFINVPDVISNTAVYFKKYNIIIANSPPLNMGNRGIGWMKVGSTFIVGDAPPGIGALRIGSTFIIG